MNCALPLRVDASTAFLLGFSEEPFYLPLMVAGVVFDDGYLVESGKFVVAWRTDFGQEFLSGIAPIGHAGFGWTEAEERGVPSFRLPLAIWRRRLPLERRPLPQPTVVPRVPEAFAKIWAEASIVVVAWPVFLSPETKSALDGTLSVPTLVRAPDLRSVEQLGRLDDRLQEQRRPTTDGKRN